jgi:Uma2 family endonuclease
MTVTTKFPVTLQERLELGAGEIRFPATFEEFVELLEICDYSIEFQKDEIIIMSIASDPHEQIVANFLYILGTIFKGNPDFKRYGSNRHVFLPAYPAAYSPDASVVKGLPNIFEYAPGKTANLNPWLLLEVLSDSTRDKDLNEKLPRYKTMPSLQYIVIAEQTLPKMTVHRRSGNNFSWESDDYKGLEQSFDLFGKQVPLADVFENVILQG